MDDHADADGPGFVAAVLGSAGVTPSEEEIATMSRLHRTMQGALAGLWMPEAADREPAVVFDPAAR
jgi:hypothetical protein